MSTLKRQRRHYSAREIRFTEWPARASVAEIIGGAGGAEVLYTIGAAPGVAVLRAWAGSEPPAGWTADAHFLTLPAPVLRYRHESGRRLEIHRAASYFGESPYTATEAGDAWRRLGALVRGAFNEGHVLATPAATGRYLLARSISGDREWPVLEAETQDFIRATTGQGRVQMFGRTGRAPLVQYDARLAYGALCSSLPAGEPTRDHLDRWEGWHRQGRYRVRFAVPADWSRRCECGSAGHAGIGLLPVREPGDSAWSYPAEPGAVATTWVDAREVGIALAHGWRVQILERLLYPHPPYPAATRANGQKSRRGPLDLWAEKLTGLRRIADDGDASAGPAELVNVALRAILLFGIGALHGAPRRMTRTVSAADARAGMIPDHARDVLPLGDRFAWTELEPVRWPEMSHPEWTAAIWARARCALLEAAEAGGGRSAGMLRVPAETVVACFTDSLYLARDPQWADDGRAGRYRRLWSSSGPVELPATAAELRRLKVAP